MFESIASLVKSFVLKHEDNQIQPEFWVYFEAIIAIREGSQSTNQNIIIEYLQNPEFVYYESSRSVIDLIRVFIKKGNLQLLSLCNQNQIRYFDLLKGFFEDKIARIKDHQLEEEQELNYFLLENLWIKSYFQQPEVVKGILLQSLSNN